jgi:exodeoxyribonuclease VII small subunit
MAMSQRCLIDFRLPRKNGANHSRQSSEPSECRQFHHGRAGLDFSKFHAVAKAEQEIPFEEAMQKLESIVDAMESGELPLESLMAKFEEGTRLAKLCQSKLAQAEVKVQQLEKSAAGDITLKPVESSNANE